MPRSSGSSAFATLALAVSAFLAVAGLAAAHAEGAGKITVQLRQVLGSDASAGPKQFDAGLEELQKQLEKYNYRVFKNAGTEKKDVAEGEEATFALSGEPGFTVRARPKGAGEHVALELSLNDPKGKEVLSTTLKVKDGGTSFVTKELESKAGRLFLFFTVKKS